MEHRNRTIDTIKQIIEIECLCRNQLIITARLARPGKDMARSEKLLSEFKSKLCALRSSRAENFVRSPRRNGA